MNRRIEENNIDGCIEEVFDVLSDITSISLNILSGTAAISCKSSKDFLDFKVSVSTTDPILILHYETNLHKYSTNDKDDATPFSINHSSPSCNTNSGHSPDITLSSHLVFLQQIYNLEMTFNNDRKKYENLGYIILDDIFSIILNVLQQAVTISSEINENFLLCKIRTSDKTPNLILVYSYSDIHLEEFQNASNDIETAVLLSSSPSDNINNFINAEHFLKVSRADNNIQDVQKQGGKSFQCRYCPLTFGIKFYLHKHEATHSEAKRFSCKICGVNFSELISRDKHEEGHKKRFKCQYCEKPFHSKFNRDIHEKSHTEDRPFKCHVCEKAFKIDRHLQRHQVCRQEERPFECSVCEKTFKSLDRLRYHQMIHTTEKTFKCKYCDKFFLRLPQKKIHESRHSEERPYRCDICKKTFHEEAKLKYHQKTHDEEQPFKCSYCIRTFADMAQKEKHEGKHLRHRPHKCLYCEETFGTISAKEMHEKKVHTGEKWYKCKYCEETFHFKGYLKFHEKTHTFAFKCSLCKKRFLNSALKELHEKEHVEKSYS